MKLLILLILLSVSIYGQNDQSEKETLVRKNIINDQIELLSNMFYNQQIEMAKEKHIDVPDSIWAKLKLKVNEQDRLLNETTKFYCEYFTLEELKEIDIAMSLPGMIKLNKFNNDENYNLKFGEIAEKCGIEIMNKIEGYLKNAGISY